MSQLGHDCERKPEGSSRRQFLRGSMGSLLTTLCWPSLVWASPLRRVPREPSVIILWMKGGPSHIDTFDPKTGTTTAGPFRRIETAIKGEYFSEPLPRLAAIADRLAVVRSVTSQEGNHARARYLMKTGYDQDATVRHPAFGSVISKLSGDAMEALPPFVSINGPSSGPGYLGSVFTAFHVNEAGKPIQNLTPPAAISEERFDRRRNALESLEELSGFHDRSEAATSLHKLRARAFSLMRSPKGKVFDLSSEPDRVRDAYGRNPFGQGCLLARRLVEAGARCVEVTIGGWDCHEDNFNQHRKLLGMFDPAFATLVLELEQADLLKTTTILAMGEFGRSPKIIPATDGRNHHPEAFSAVLAGGGIRGGRVHGQTDERGEKIVKDPVTIPDLLTTLCVPLGIDPNRSFRTPAGRPIQVVENGAPIREILLG